MTIYELSQALKRYWIPSLVAFLLLVMGVMFMTFTLEDGKPRFRSGLTYESGVQIQVVGAGTESLISSAPTEADLRGRAVLYASLLSSDEASKWIGEQNGFELESAVNAIVADDSSIIYATVEAPTAALSRAAALSTFDWLNTRLLEPIATADFPEPPAPEPQVILDGPFESFLSVEVADDMDGTPDELFLSVESDRNTPLTFSLQQNAGRTVRADATLDPLMTVVVSLRGADDVVLDSIRLAPPVAPRIVDYVPELGISVSEASIRSVVVEDGVRRFELGTDDITLEWLEGTPSATAETTNAVNVDLIMLTTEPGFLTSGGRRGPILAITAIVIGTLAIIATVIVADTWRTQRDAAVNATDAGEERDDNIRATHEDPTTSRAQAGNGEVSGQVQKTRRRKRPADVPRTEVEVKTTNLE